jgi:hypothetical protein
MFQKLVLTLLMAGLTVAASAETVYKWVDARGQIYYTDLPPRQPDAKILGIFHEEIGVVDEESEEGAEGEEGEDVESPSTPPDDMDPGAPPVTSDVAAAVEADVANARLRQCKEAQDRYKTYVESRRLFRQMPDGKRQYLTDKELDEARVRAKQAVDEYCS